MNHEKVNELVNKAQNYNDRLCRKVIDIKTGRCCYGHALIDIIRQLQLEMEEFKK
jgi:hypothetical protein